MALNAPIITFPTTEPVISTNLDYISLVGTADAGVDSILVTFNGVQSSGDFVSTSGGTSWSFGPVALELGTNTFVVTATSGNIGSGPDNFTVIYDPNMETDLITLLPTGFVLKQQRDAVKLVVPAINRQDFIGYNFYGSEDPGGGAEGFKLLTQSPVTAIDFTEEKAETTFITETVLTGQLTIPPTDNDPFILIDKSVQNHTVTVTERSLDVLEFYSYVHNRVTNPIVGSSKPITEKNHYVVTSVFFDATNKKLVESRYSEELSGKPFVIDTQLKDIEQRTEEEFRVGIIDQLLQSNRNIDVKPGTVLRDTVINPSSTLLSRNFAMLRFFSAAQSFATLLAYDDPENTGISAPVLTTQNKNELRLALLIPEANAQSVQDLIDVAFDKLASNVNTVRFPAQQATGQITVYTKRPPDRDAVVQAGAICETLADTVSGEPAVRYVALSSFILRADPNLNFPYYNQTTKRYEFKINVRAEIAGTTGNQDAGKIITPVSGFDPIFGVVNEAKTRFGQDKESNVSLAERAELAFFVDSGTESGYYSTAIKNVGVERVIVVAANHPLMQRDLDPLREIHFFGKVDIYIKGVSNKTIIEAFGFRYRKVIEEVFTLQSLPFLQLRATNTDIDSDHPIFRVVEVLNQTQNKLYNLTDLVISNDGNVIDLDESIQGFTTNPNDLIKVTYVYRRADNIRLLTQPVETIISITGSISGDLTPENYTLVRSDDPLLLGRSTEANDAIQFNYVNGMPSGEVLEITGEPIILTGVDEISVQNFGVDESTIVVRDDADENIANTYILNIDYQIVPGSVVLPTKLKRVSSGSIANGQEVFVSYEAGEIMQVQYEVNDLLLTVQEKVDEMKHLCADVVVKSAQLTSIVLRMLIVLDVGADVTVVDRNIRNNILTFLRQNKLGLSVYQSDIIALAEKVTGVSHVIVPITQMTKKDGAQVIREKINTPQFTDYQLVTVQAYKSTAILESKTLETGGKLEEFRGIFQDDFLLEMVDADTKVAEGAGRGFITADGHIIVSTRHGTDPDESDWTVTYTAYGETGAKDIILSSIEYADVGAGDLVITYSNGVVTTGI